MPILFAMPPSPAERLLFICTHNLSRSFTAELLLRDVPEYEVRSAGTYREARVLVTEELVRWADRIFVMEEHHVESLRERFPMAVAEKTIICLEIPDVYQPLAEDLFEILVDRLAPHLRFEDTGME